MKNILLATDLSAGAASAARYAAWLSGLLGARLTLMSAYSVAPALAGRSISESPDDGLREFLIHRLAEAATRLGSENRISIDILARAGDPVPAILGAARDIHADLIAVGKAGGRHVGKSDAGRPTTSGFDDTVVALARKTHIPLLIVPQEAGCIPPKVIAVTKELLAGEIPGALRELIGHFACRLYLFEVKAKTRSENVEVYVADAIHSAKELFHLLYEIPVDSKLQHSMENFIDVVPIDWLVARSLPSLTPERWLLGGHSRELAFDIRVPLLILPETEKKTARRDRKKSP